MSSDEINLHFEAFDNYKVKIHVSIQVEDELSSYLFECDAINYVESFYKWLLSRTHQSIDQFRFEFSGFTDAAFELFSKLYHSGAKVCLA